MAIFSGMSLAVVIQVGSLAMGNGVPARAGAVILVAQGEYIVRDGIPMEGRNASGDSSDLYQAAGHDPRER